MSETHWKVAICNNKTFNSKKGLRFIVKMLKVR